jgi:hypothetical protein
MSAYIDKIIKLVTEGEEFNDAQAYGYITEGGTMIVGSAALVNDDSEDHDLMAITPMLDVYPLRLTAYIAPVVAEMELLKRAFAVDVQELDEPQLESEPWYDQPD